MELDSVVASRKQIIAWVVLELHSCNYNSYYLSASIVNCPENVPTLH
jgi:hypothetical protein